MLRLIGRLKSYLKKTNEIVKDFLSEPDRLVFFFDEGRFGLKPSLGRYWARKGTRPHSAVKPGYTNFYLYSSVSPHTGESFTLLLPWVNTEVMNFYLKALSNEYPNKKLMLIMDGAGWHHSKELMSHENIKIEFLPAYSPELNPVEKLWQWLRRHVCRNRLFCSENELVESLCEGIQKLLKPQLASLCRCSYLLDFN